MSGKIASSRRRFSVERSIEIDACLERVFDRWSRYEEFPHFMECVRHTKQIDERRVLWDVDITGRQLVWEARIVETVPDELIRWESVWGASNRGEIHFEPLSDCRTRLTVVIEYRPRGVLEQLAARARLVDLQVRRDLARFRRVVERLRPDREPEAS